MIRQRGHAAMAARREVHEKRFVWLPRLSLFKDNSPRGVSPLPPVSRFANPPKGSWSFGR